jgi:hypothetical protein
MVGRLVHCEVPMSGVMLGPMLGRTLVLLAFHLLDLPLDVPHLVLQAFGLVMASVAAKLLHLLVQMTHPLVQLFHWLRTVAMLAVAMLAVMLLTVMLLTVVLLAIVLRTGVLLAIVLLAVVLRTGVLRALHLFGLAKQPFCFALELFSLCAQLAGIWLVSDSDVGNERENQPCANQRHQESSHLKSPEPIGPGGKETSWTTQSSLALRQ